MNKYQKAFNVLDTRESRGYTEHNNASKVIQELVDKATPRKDFDEDDCCFYAYGTVGDPTQWKYCPNCGQALDWSEE